MSRIESAPTECYATFWDELPTTFEEDPRPHEDGEDAYAEFLAATEALTTDPE